MKLITVSKGLLAVVLAAASGQFIVGCGSAGQAAPAGQSEATEGIRGELLATVQVSEKHRVDFYDYGKGAVGAHEMVEIGDDILFDKLKTKPTLAEIFTLAKPGAEVPRALLDAQTRADAFNKQSSRVAEALDNNLPPSNVERPITPSATGNVASQSQALACSDDLLGDSWGAQWFLDNYCNEGCFRNCSTNVVSSNWNTTKDWFKWKVMAADFNVVAHSKGSHECGICASAELIWSHDVQPRMVSIHTMTSGYHWYASASSACRMHTAALRCD